MHGIDYLNTWWNQYGYYPDESEKKKMSLQLKISIEVIEEWFQKKRNEYLYEVFNEYREDMMKNRQTTYDKNASPILPLSTSQIIDYFEKDMLEALIQSNLLFLQNCVDDLVSRLTSWRQFVFFIDYVNEGWISFDCLMYACGLLKGTEEEIICVDLLHYALIKKKFLYASGLMMVGVPSLPMHLPDGTLIDVSELCKDLKDKDNMKG